MSYWNFFFKGIIGSSKYKHDLRLCPTLLYINHNMNISHILKGLCVALISHLVCTIQGHVI